MKQSVKNVTMLAALLLSVVGAWADQSVTIAYKNAGWGAVTSSVSEGVCTLTATPAPGYYLTVANLSAVTVVDGGNAQAPRRAPDIGSPVPISATDATADPGGVTTYTFTMPKDQNVGVEVTADFQRGYGLMVNSVLVTDLNHSDVLKDGTVFFDSKSRLVLNKAKLNSISLLQGNPLTEGLSIYLVGDNSLTASEPAIVNEGKTMPLTLTTSGTEPGSLTYQLASASVTLPEQAFPGFSPVTCENKLALSLNDNEDGTKTVYVGITIQPIVNDSTEENKTTEVDFGDDGEVTTGQLTNVVIDNILYTLNDTQTAGADDDGFVGDNNGMIVLNSAMTEQELQEAMTLQPGTPEYAEKFKGLTFMLPPGTGRIEITSFAEAGHALCVKLGTAEPVVLAHEQLEKDTIPYAVIEPTYVYIYHIELATAQAASAKAGHRIGPKTHVSTGMTGLNVSANEVDTPPTASSNYKMLSSDDIAEMEMGYGKGLTISDESITDLSDDLFNNLRSAQGAPRRAASAAADVPFIDLRGTSVTGKEIDRSAGVFRQIPNTTFIYVPAGNTTVSPNVIIGSVCQDMQLAGDSKMTYSQVANFTAVKAEYAHLVKTGTRSTLYLPFAITDPDNYGTFYEYKGLEGTTVKMDVVEHPLQPNEPYVVKAVGADITSIKVSNAAVTRAASTASTGFVGTYTEVAADGGANIYQFQDATSDGKTSAAFAPLASGQTILPFCAYLVTDAVGANYTVKWSDDITTAIQHVTHEQTTQDDWFTLGGNKLTGRPAAKGVYIHQGKKMVIE